jgi:hypothetical protein
VKALASVSSYLPRPAENRLPHRMTDLALRTSVGVKITPPVVEISEGTGHRRVSMLGRAQICGCFRLWLNNRRPAHDMPILLPRAAASPAAALVFQASGLSRRLCEEFFG